MRTGILATQIGIETAAEIAQSWATRGCHDEAAAAPMAAAGNVFGQLNESSVAFNVTAADNTNGAAGRAHGAHQFRRYRALGWSLYDRRKRHGSSFADHAGKSDDLESARLGHGALEPGSVEGQTDVVTRKNLIVRLEGPRFFVEKDEVVLSANVHNYLKTAKQVTVALELGWQMSDIAMAIVTQQVEVPSGGEVRVDWRVKVAHEGDRPSSE